MPPNEPDPDADGRAGASPSPGSTIADLVRDTVPTLQRAHRSFVVVVGVVAIMLVAILFAASDVTTIRWATGGVLLLFALIAVLLFLARETSDGQDTDHEKRQRAASSVNGDWWEAVLSRAPEGGAAVEALTLMSIRLLVGEGRYEIQGRLFDGTGAEKATWYADAVALTSLAPVELFYRWRGYSFRSDVAAEREGDVNGIGTFRFHSGEEHDVCTTGDGWYGIGDVDRLQFGARRDVRLRRLTADEAQVMAQGHEGDGPRERRGLVVRTFAGVAGSYGADPELGVV